MDIQLTPEKKEKREPKKDAVFFRASYEEKERVKAVADSLGFDSMSEFVRSIVMQVVEAQEDAQRMQYVRSGKRPPKAKNIAIDRQDSAVDVADLPF